MERTIANSQNLRKCLNYLKAFGSALLSFLLAVPYQSLSLSLPVLSLWKSKKIAHAAQVVRATLAEMRPQVSSGISNNRIYAGLFLVVVVATPSTCIHMLPGMKDLVSLDWYYECWYNLFLVLGPYFCCLCIIAAAFLWIPPSTLRIKISKKPLSFQLTRILFVPFGLIVGKIVWLIFCDSNDDFERLGHPLFFLGGLIVGYVVIRIMDYLAWRQEHAMNALIDSLDGIYKMDMDHEARQQMTAPYWQELRQFNSKY